MTKWLAMLMACLALGLVAAGCGGDDDDDSGGSAATPTTEEPAGGGGAAEDTGGAPAGKTVEVSIKGFAFNPKDASVAKGGTIKWTNDDSAGHDVTKTGGSGPDFSSGDPGGLNQGDAYEETFDTPGEIDYVCTVHPGMEGTITVK